jgi:agmatinase
MADEATPANASDSPTGPVDARSVPRFAGLSTFARLPELRDVERTHVAISGVPFDSGVTYRPGARFGPSYVRQASRLLRSYHPGLDVEPFTVQQVADAGDIACNPFDIDEAINEIERATEKLLGQVEHVITIGGDHTIALPLLRATKAKFGQVALVHLDAHLDTWDTYFGAPYTHGTPFRRAAEEALFLDDRSIHIGIRGPLYARLDLTEDRDLGFAIVHAEEFHRTTIDEIAARVRQRVTDAPVYVSIDIDVLDPAFAPGTGTPEPGGLSSRELLLLLRALGELNLVGADLVEVAPVYDHAEITSLAASHVVYELLGLMAGRRVTPPGT